MSGAPSSRTASGRASRSARGSTLPRAARPVCRPPLMTVAPPATVPRPPTAAVRQPLLELRGISKHFGAVQALSSVDFEVYPSEVVGLVGDNGAGKSTLIKTIAGIYMPDSGEYRFDGRPVSVKGPNDVTRLGIATVYQDLALCDNLDVVDNLFLGREMGMPGLGPLDEVGMEERALGVLQRLSVKIPNVRTPIAALSGGQRLGVVVISHNLADVFEVCDRIIVLRLGRRVASFDVHDVDRERVVSAITGAEFGESADSEA